MKRGFGPGSRRTNAAHMENRSRQEPDVHSGQGLWSRYWPVLNEGCNARKKVKLLRFCISGCVFSRSFHLLLCSDPVFSLRPRICCNSLFRFETVPCCLDASTSKPVGQSPPTAHLLLGSPPPEEPPTYHPSAPLPPPITVPNKGLSKPRLLKRMDVKRRYPQKAGQDGEPNLRGLLVGD